MPENLWTVERFDLKCFKLVLDRWPGGEVAMTDDGGGWQGISGARPCTLSRISLDN